jgi:hypothetical protein
MRINRRGVLKLLVVTLVVSVVAIVVTTTNKKVKSLSQDKIHQKTFIFKPNGKREVTLHHKIGQYWIINGAVELIEGDKGVEYSDRCSYEGDKNSVTFIFEEPRYGTYRVTLMWKDSEKGKRFARKVWKRIT